MRHIIKLEYFLTGICGFEVYAERFNLRIVCKAPQGSFFKWSRGGWTLYKIAQIAGQIFPVKRHLRTRQSGRRNNRPRGGKNQQSGSREFKRICLRRREICLSRKTAPRANRSARRRRILYENRRLSKTG